MRNAIGRWRRRPQPEMVEDGAKMGREWTGRVGVGRVGVGRVGGWAGGGGVIKKFVVC